MRLALRSIAIVIAIAGAIDPAFSVSRSAPQEVIAVRMTSSSSSAVEQSLRDALPGWNVITREAAMRLPCDPNERCVVIADGSVDADVPADLAVPPALIKLAPGVAPNVSLRSVGVSRTHQTAAGLARVVLAAQGVDGKQSEIRILDGAAVVGSVMHQWSSGSATVDVPWWPIDTGARALHVEAVPIEGEATTIDNQIDVGINVEAAASPVLVFDARPSWNSSFIRRALEDDARFTVGYRARLAPSLSTGTINGNLDAATLDNASAVVIGGPDALTDADVRLLDQYIRVRGGSVILLPERIPAAPSAQLFGGAWSEHLVASPEAVGALRASEILRLDRPPVTSTVIAASGTGAAIALIPSGNGRVIVSGAMDAWRYRDATAFDAFWRSLVAEGAMQGAGVQLKFDEDLAAAGERVAFTLRDQRMTPAVSSEASATITCEDRPASAVRLWPAGVLGEFSGDVQLPAGSCVVDATIGDRHITGAIAAARRPMRGVDRTLSKLEHRIKESGGIIVTTGDEKTIAKTVQQQALAAPVITAVHPMRGAWWILPFAGCLSAEWWLRRRNGLR